MRVHGVFLALALSLSAGCAHHYALPPSTATETGEVSTFPAFVIDPSTATERDGGTYSTFRGCSATYVAPHLLLTSATAFPEIAPGTRRSDVPIVVRTADGSWLHVTGVAYLGAGDGIALIRTWESGPAARLGLMATPNHDLTAVGFHYGAVPSDGSLPPTASYRTQVRPEPEPYSSGGTFIRFRFTPGLEQGSCGAPLLDRNGDLAGMVHERHGEWMSAISAPAIAEAIERAR
ncbi:MAG TPA: hypothetical protein VL500_07595 [Candidatus Eisenbacteria bacterium]|nr:hypothetical protein [Candidatus Eisenbacteria bacterium]